MERINVAIIGGGIVGLAIAHELAANADDVFLLEQMPRLGMMTSTRSSGVLHAGIYYAPGSLKARLCVAGNRLIKQFCESHGVSHKTCGKLVVALEPSEIEQLERLAERARANGVENLRVIDATRIRRLEPHVTAIAALEVHSTGVVNAEELVKTYARLAANRGVSILTEARVVGLEPRVNSIVVSIERGDLTAPTGSVLESFEARCVVNSAGLYADDVAALVDGKQTHRIYPVRGEYAQFQRSKAHLVNALVYPLPHGDVLARDVTKRRIHLTRTVEGTLLAGPTARYVSEKNDYERDRLPVEEFLKGVLPLLPVAQLADLRLAYSGLRPQLVPPGGQGSADFVIEHSSSCRRLINLIGMESPALTAAPAIAQYVAPLVGETLS
jgi:L-2-hydroxyglutarate oxidase LhgO